ncbi:hypothetical protein MJO28_004025 [Puccinia striiformis f. sp. tritici]|uniref:Uncharacterized protein n=1 Tax=Puccinia striiformis f. sp. tritici TaxID=168172 RepID=A0ACC0ENZ6_9BASI|nr:hypothetical protein MJO28_004025 [Puccinia striiformis f. sp. tritici]
MPPFKGVGGKKKPRVRKPTTSTGIALSQSLQLEETNALSLSNNTDRQGILHIDQNRPTGVEVVENSEDQINQYVDDNQMRYENLPNPPNNSQVHNLLDYLQSNDYQIKKLLEEKHWKEVFEGMFSWFHQCSAKYHNGETSHVGIVIGKEHVGSRLSAMTILPFSQSIDEFLDANNPLILVNHGGMDEETSYVVRQWRQTMSSAVDAYREMLRREKNFTERLLKMQPIDKLSDICPKCFGPLVLGKKEHEPDYILCMDANFQQRRHVASSVEIHSKPETPSLFIDPDKVQLMENGMKEDNQEGESVDQMDRCTEQHTAANDVRGSNTWKACDDTGIFGMACRHDQVLRLINIFGSGEKYVKCKS